MQNNGRKKTKSARSQSAAAAFVITAFLVVVAIIIANRTNLTQRKQLVTGGSAISLAVANTGAKHERGLSGQATMAPSEGMLFEYASPGKRCMWMKDMSFSLDIVWLDAQKRITHIEKRVSPDTYPEQFCAMESQYVIELMAGTADHARLATGQRLQF